MHIVVVTTGLRAGGAETVLLHLVRQWRQEGHEVTILSLSSKCHLDNSFLAMDVEVKNYSLKNYSEFVQGCVQLFKDIKSLAPDIVQTWMPHADLIGSVIARLAISAPIIWGCHHSDFSRKNLRMATYIICKINAFLSHFMPDKIIAVSHHVQTQLMRSGFAKHKIVVVENGIDCGYFKKVPDAKQTLAKELDIRRHKRIVGFVGRFSSEKRVEDFLALATILNKTRDDLHFALIGDGHSFENRE